MPNLAQVLRTLCPSSEFNFSYFTHSYNYYIPRRKLGIYWIQVRRAAAAAAVEISLWTR